MTSTETHQAVTTRLLTLLNVSALSTKKRKRDDESIVDPPPPSKKLNAKKVSLQDAQTTEEEPRIPNKREINVEVDEETEDDSEEKGKQFPLVLREDLIHDIL
jgi:hypothetical protein